VRVGPVKKKLSVMFIVIAAKILIVGGSKNSAALKDS
jgi:hypothetical protein